MDIQEMIENAIREETEGITDTIFDYANDLYHLNNDDMGIEKLMRYLKIPEPQAPENESPVSGIMKKYKDMQMLSGSLRIQKLFYSNMLVQKKKLVVQRLIDLGFIEKIMQMLELRCDDGIKNTSEVFPELYDFMVQEKEKLEQIIGITRTKRKRRYPPQNTYQKRRLYNEVNRNRKKSR